MKEKILYGTRKDQPDWKEEIITVNEKHFQQAKLWARINGFDRFRVAIIDLRVAPDFTKCVKEKLA